MVFHRRFADNTSPTSVATRLRRRRFEILSRITAKLPGTVRILDVGGTPGYWRMLPPDRLQRFRITLLNVRPSPVPSTSFTSLVGDARAMSCFEDKSFDVVFSNSVIEHVGGAEQQRCMASEVRRVGRYFYVQTPNRWFPIEPHFEFPLFQFLPIGLRTRLIQHFDLGWYRRIPDPRAAEEHVRSIRLLARGEFAALFPGATIFTERFLGLAKSFVAFTEP